MLSLTPLARTDRWLPAAAAALSWALAVAGATLWWLHAPHGGTQALAPAQMDGSAVSSAGGTSPVARALGQGATTVQHRPEAQRRFQLLGVVATASGQGAALLVVDGQAPQAFVQGQSVMEGWRVQSLKPDGVLLQTAGAPPLELSVPAR